jgi:hypothetical protein
MKLTVDSTKVLRLLTNAKDEHKKIMLETLTFFKKVTPVNKGNARRNTKLITNVPNKTTILADYAYAGKLEEGSSDQAPEGMTKPAITYIKKTALPKSTRRVNRG